MRKSLVAGALALAAIVPVAAAAPNGGPSKPVGSETAVVRLVCNHYAYYLHAFAGHPFYVNWIRYVHAVYCD